MPCVRCVVDTYTALGISAVLGGRWEGEERGSELKTNVHREMRGPLSSPPRSPFSLPLLSGLSVHGVSSVPVCVLATTADDAAGWDMEQICQGRLVDGFSWVSGGIAGSGSCRNDPAAVRFSSLLPSSFMQLWSRSHRNTTSIM
jgi:hypothetical protein